LDKKLVKKYIRRVKRVYYGKRKGKKQFIQELEDALYCFCEKNPESSYSDLVAEFGEPSEIKNMLSFRSAKELHRRNMFVYWTAIILICAAILIALGFTIRYAVRSHELTQEYDVEYWEDDEDAPKDVNPFTGEADPTPYQEITFD
jgi:hypothetical protein